MIESRIAPLRHKLIAILIICTLATLAVTPAMSANDKAARRPRRFQRLPFNSKPNIANKKETLRMPLDPFAAPVISPQFRRKRAGLELGRDDDWMYSPQMFRRLSQSAQRYLTRNSMPQMKALRSAMTGNDTAAMAMAASGENLRVNNPAQDKDDRTQSETSAAVFGRNIVVSFNDSAGLDLDNLAGLSYSNDNGATWRQSRVPRYLGGVNLGDGVLAVDTKGNFYYSMIAFDLNNRVTVGVSRSTDGGATWGRLVNGSTTATQDNAFQDKEWMTVDRSPASRFKDSVYLCWTNFLNNGKSRILFARSKDQARTFKAPVVVAESATQSGFVQGSMVATGPAGEVYVTWIDAEFGKTTIKLAKSVNGGKSFSAPATLVSFRNPTFPANGIFDANTFPSIGVDISTAATRGNIYIVYAARPANDSFDRSNIFLVASSDGGVTWTAPRLLNDDNSDAEQLLPSVAVADDGAVAATWYDRRNDLANLSLVDVYAVVSTDGGRNFAPNRRITTTNWPVVPTPFNLRAGYHGDYHQLTTRGNQFLFNWADDRSGTDSDVYIAFKSAEELAKPSPDFIVSARTASQITKAGGSASFTIDTRALDGATGQLALSATPTLPGLTYSFSNANATMGESITLTVQTARELKPGPYTITVTARNGDKTRATSTRLAVLDLNELVKTPQSVVPNRSGTLFPRAAIDDAGNINVAWLDDSPGIFSVFFTRSTDGGNTFTTPLKIPRNDSFIGTPLIAANDREIYIGYLELFETPDFIFRTSVTRSTDGGKTFSPTRFVTENDRLLVISETMQLDSDGTLHFSVQTLRPPDSTKPSFANFDARSTDGGQTFTLNKIHESPAPLSTPIIAVEGDGQTIRALFADFDRERGGLLFTQSHDGGLTYDKPTTLPVRLDRLIFAGAFFAGNNRTHVIFTEGSINDEEFALFYTRSDGSGRFIRPVPITSDAATVLSASVAADDDGNIVIAFEGSMNKFFDVDFMSRIFYCNSTDDGVTFSRANNFKPERGGALLPVVLLDTTGNFAILWDGFSNGATDVFYSLSEDKGRTFGAPVNLTSSAGFSSYADITFDERGRFQLLFQDNTGGSFDFFKITLGKP